MYDAGRPQDTPGSLPASRWQFGDPGRARGGGRCRSFEMYPAETPTSLVPREVPPGLGGHRPPLETLDAIAVTERPFRTGPHEAP